MNIIDTHEKLVEAMKAQGGSCAAYACEMKDGGFIVDTGLTLRDHFAGLALAALVTNGGRVTVTDPDYTQERVLAECSYKLADAMLAERSKP